MTPIQTTIQKASEQIQRLYQEASLAIQNSHSPYSRCKVGAAIRTSSGEIFSGCNVENASYGASICAEQTAIVKAVSTTGKIKIEEILVITDATPPWPPCGICRQIIAEFAENSGAHLIVHATNLKGDMLSYNWNDLLPQAFTPSNLPS